MHDPGRVRYSNYVTDLLILGAWKRNKSQLGVFNDRINPYSMSKSTFRETYQKCGTYTSKPSFRHIASL